MSLSLVMCARSNINSRSLKKLVIPLGWDVSKRGALGLAGAGIQIGIDINGDDWGPFAWLLAIGLHAERSWFVKESGD